MDNFNLNLSQCSNQNRQSSVASCRLEIEETSKNGTLIMIYNNVVGYKID